MAMIYTLVGKEDRIFAEYTSFSGNFAVTAAQILKKCSPSKSHMRYASGKYIFYVLYIDAIFLVMCEAKYSQRIAFAFLEKIKKLFAATYTIERIQRAKTYEFMEFVQVLRPNLELYNTPEEVDNVARLLKETEQVSEIISEDLRKVINRGEKIEVLVRKTETMSSLSLDLRSTSRTVKNQMTWRNWKMRIMLALVILAVFYLILVFACGSITLSGCI